MKINKQIMYAAVAGVILGGAMGFGSANQRDHASETLVTTKYGKISQQKYYNQIKDSTSAKQLLQAEITKQIVQHKYGHKVSDKMVNESYQNTAAAFGADWDAALKKSSYTEKTFKQQIRDNFEMRIAITENMELSNQDYVARFKTFQPKVTIAQIMLGNEKDAKKVIKQLNAGADFNELVKTESLDMATNSHDGELAPFDNNTKIDTAIKTAAFKLKKGEYSSTPVKGAEGYYVIKMLSNSDKGTWQAHKAELKNLIVDEYIAGEHGAGMKKIIKKLYQAANVDITDKSLKSLETVK
ncbi:hypothetical protein EQG49_07860 [Periweissella cryptocerci]|uniref:Foldase protein PrsA n=1 Tax=Periweissella cryptocerci TaxID=2506420 RepID=A0A4P6YUC4_9LACO|nr:peptidylprolyl isomerase [Periweissella cryptocerci]QBO36384.1 hypothetical protein EQG49_07860 [Periweissella cryptocerci]